MLAKGRKVVSLGPWNIRCPNFVTWLRSITSRRLSLLFVLLIKPGQTEAPHPGGVKRLLPTTDKEGFLDFPPC